MFKLCGLYENWKGISAHDKNRLDSRDIAQNCVDQTFVKLELMTQKEMDRLYIAFDKIGAPINGQEKDVISLQDVYFYLKIEQTDFLDMVFTGPISIQNDYEAYATQRTKKKVRSKEPSLDYGAWCMAIWLLTHYEIGTLTFKMIDSDGSGYLDATELESIVSLVYQNSSARAGLEINTMVNRVAERAKKMFEGMDVNGDGQITLQEFVVMVQNYHYLLLPAFVSQQKCRQRVFGYYVDWFEAERKRSKHSQTKISDIVKDIYKGVNGSFQARSFAFGEKPGEKETGLQKTTFQTDARMDHPSAIGAPGTREVAAMANTSAAFKAKHRASQSLKKTAIAG